MGEQPSTVPTTPEAVTARPDFLEAVTALRELWSRRVANRGEASLWDRLNAAARAAEDFRWSMASDLTEQFPDPHIEFRFEVASRRRFLVEALHLANRFGLADENVPWVVARVLELDESTTAIVRARGPEVYTAVVRVSGDGDDDRLLVSIDTRKAKLADVRERVSEEWQLKEGRRAIHDAQVVLRVAAEFDGGCPARLRVRQWQAGFQSHYKAATGQSCSGRDLWNRVIAPAARDGTLRLTHVSVRQRPSSLIP